MRRRKLLGALALAVLAVALTSVVAFMLWPAPVTPGNYPGVNQASFSKIQPGMSLAAVEAILGGPPVPDPDNDRVGDFFFHRRHELERWHEMERAGLYLSPSGRPPTIALAGWPGTEINITILFDVKTEKVLVKVWSQNQLRKNPGPFDTFTDWLELQWQHWFP